MTTLPETAHRIIFPAPGEVSLERFKLPSLDADCLRVRTLFSLMSTGTETTILHQRYAPGTHFDRMFSFPQLQTGVQAVGIVEARGDITDEQAGEINVGDIVYIRHAHASHQIVNSTACSVIPKELDLRAACWAGLAKTAFRAAWAGQFSRHTNTLIFGAGPVGQMLTRWAASLGCPNIIVVDISAPRLAFASNGGATQTLQGEADQLAEHERHSAMGILFDWTDGV